MKKTIISLGLALVAMVNVAAATNVNLPATQNLASVNVRTATPLCVAISKGELEIVKKFVEYGADVNEKSNGLTPLMIAATYNKVEIIKYLLSKGANPKIATESGYTALKFAELSKSTEAAEVLAAVN